MIKFQEDITIDFNTETNEKDPKFKTGDHVIISKYKNIFVNFYTRNWSEDVCTIKKVRNNLPNVINDLNSDVFVRTFYEKRIAKIMKKSLELKKQSREKAISYMLNGKDTIMLLIAT